MTHSTKDIIAKILDKGAPWSKLILLSPESELYEREKIQVKNHPHIKYLKKYLHDAQLGIPLLDAIPADFRNTNTFYWILRFFADLGLTGWELGIDSLINRLLLNQTESGQFQLNYHEKKAQSIELTCMTANLVYCLTNLGYGRTNAVAAGKEFLLATQKSDGSWHCDVKYFPGEKFSEKAGCPGATISAIRALSLFLPDTKNEISNGIAFFENHFEAADFSCPFLSSELPNFRKLRYPPLFVGMDLLNVFDSLSLASNFVKPEFLKSLTAEIFSHTGPNGLLISDKRLPFWKAFDFAHNKNESFWLSAIFAKALRRIEEAKIKYD